MIEKFYLSEDFKLIVPDQSIFPSRKKNIICNCFDDIFDCINKKQINGYSLIAVALIYGLCIDLMKFKSQNKKNLRIHLSNLVDTCLKIEPNNQIINYCINRFENVFDSNINNEDPELKFLELAEELFEEDDEISKRIALNGSDLISNENGILVYGNGSQFNTCGEGITTGIIKESAKQSKEPVAFVLESRTDIVNSLLTSYDLQNSRINFSVLPGLDFSDLLKDSSVDCVILSSKNVSSNGSAILDVGAYNVAVNCSFHKIPLYIALPSTSINFNTNNFNEIELQEFDEDLLNNFEGIQLYPADYSVTSLSENIIKPEFITAFITENKVHYPPYNFVQIKHTFRSYINSLNQDSAENPF
jgi:methylthioribose-1-phosphate isomerase